MLKAAHLLSHTDSLWTHTSLYGSGVARVFPGGRLAYPENQNEEENKESLRKNKENWSKFEEKVGIVGLLPTRDCEAGYGPAKFLYYTSLYKTASKTSKIYSAKKATGCFNHWISLKIMILGNLRGEKNK